MTRRFTWSGGLHLLILLWASDLPGQGGKHEAVSTIQINAPDASYLGQKPPGDKPERFAPGILAANPFLGRLAFSPDGRECFFTIDDATYSSQSLLVTRYVNGVWTPQVLAPFAAGFERSGEPFFSADGNKLYFTAQARGSGSRMDIWMVDRSAQGWGAPVRLPSPANSDANEFCFSRMPDGTMYFLSGRSGSPQVYRARQKPDQSLQVELVPPPVLSLGTYEGDPCVAPDGRFMVFYSGRAGGFGAVDLHVSFPDGKGEWTKPVNLGAEFNTADDEYGATLSPDGKYLFFVRHSAQKGELYWVSTQAIEKRRTASAGSSNASAASNPPTHAYVVQGKPSALVQNHEAMLALALQVERDLKTDLGTSVIQDDIVRQRIYVGLYGIAMLKKDHAEARRYLELVRGLQADPAGRLLTGVITVPYMEALDHPGSDFHATFRTLLSRRLAALPYKDVQAALSAMKDSLEGTSKAALIGAIEAGLDPVVKDGQVTQGIASGLVSTAMNLEVILPVKDDVVISIEAFLEAHKAAQPVANPAGTASQAVSQTLPDGPCFGQEPPGPEPKVFAPGIVSLPDRREMKVAFSPDNQECLIGIGDGSTFKLLYTSQLDGHWSQVRPADFITTPRAQEPFFSPDGRKIFFTSSADIYVSTRGDKSWTAPVKLGPPVNTGAEEYHPTVTLNGTLYFCSMRDHPSGDIFRSRFENGGYFTVEKLDATINSHTSEQDGAYDPFIAPDESYIVFTSLRSDGHGKGDAFISYRTTNGSWTRPTNLGPGINTDAAEYGSYVGPGSKYYFFARPSGWGPGGPSDLYWVRADFLDTLRPKSPS